MSSSALPAVETRERASVLERVRQVDWILFVAVLALIGFGLIMIASASSLSADSTYGDQTHFLLRQGAGIGVGLVLLVGAVLTPWMWLRRAAWPAYGLGIVGLGMVFSPLGSTVLGATRWLSLGGINVQPSEFAKIGLILLLARYLSANEGRLGDLLGVVLPVLALCVPVIVLMMMEPDFGTTVVTCMIVALMLFVAGLHMGWFVTLGTLGVLALSGLAVLEPYRIERLSSVLDPVGQAEGSGYQVVQGWIALASGGWYGQGVAEGVAQRGNLPEAHTDFISAVVGEELGALGWALLIALYLILVWRGFGIAARSKTLFGTLLATAVSGLLALQTVINLGVVVGWVPPKGLVLPFMSYGASAAVAHLLCIGLLLRVSMQTHDAPATQEASP